MLFSGVRQLAIGAAAAARDLRRRDAHRRRRRGLGERATWRGRADDLEAGCAAEGLDPGAWSNGPHDRYAAHDHGYDKVLVCAAGSIRFGLPGDRRRARSCARATGWTCRPGPRHDASVGPDGVTCLEAHLPAGRIPALRRLDAGAW